jgi:hypothetical protein
MLVYCEAFFTLCGVLLALCSIKRKAVICLFKSVPKECTPDTADTTYTLSILIGFSASITSAYS